MIFNKISQLDDVDKFVVSPYGLFCLNKERDIPQIPEFDLPGAGFDKYVQMGLGGDFLVLQDKFRRVIVFDLKNQKIAYQHTSTKEVGYGFSGSSIAGDRHLLCSRKVDGEYTRYICDMDSFHMTDIEKRFNRVVDDGKTLLQVELKPASIARFDLQGEQLWKHDITGSFVNVGSREEKPNKLSRILGKHDGLIWLANHDDELYSLYIETGVKVNTNSDAGNASYYAIDKKKNRLVSIDQDRLRVVDISDQKFELSEIDMKQEYETIGCTPEYFGSPFPLVGSHLIFCNRFLSVIGSINIDSGKLDWSYDFFDDRDMETNDHIKEMTYLDNKLYVHFMTGTLHVFEVAA